MKDAYSFHVDVEDAQREYEKMYETYQRIFTRCGLAFRAVEADTGNIGGSLSHEFQVLTETGEDALVACDSCDYAANVEQAVARAPKAGAPSRRAEQTRVATPGKHSIADVSAFLKVAARQAGQDAHLPGRRQAGGGAGARRSRRQRDQAEEGARRRPAGAGDRRGGQGGHRRAGRLRRPGRPQGADLRRPRDLRAGGLRRRRERGGRAPDRRQHRARLHADRLRRLPRGRGGRRLRALRQGAPQGLPRHRGRPRLLPRHEVLEADGRDVPGRGRARRRRPRWAATASASRASSRRRSSRATTRTASSGRCRWRRTRWRCSTCSRTTRTSSRRRRGSTTS